MKKPIDRNTREVFCDMRTNYDKKQCNYSVTSCSDPFICCVYCKSYPCFKPKMCELGNLGCSYMANEKSGRNVK